MTEVQAARPEMTLAELGAAIAREIDPTLTETKTATSDKNVNGAFDIIWKSIQEAGGGRIFLADELLSCPQNAIGLKWGVLRTQVAILQRDWLARNGYIGKEADRQTHRRIAADFVKHVNASKNNNAGRY